MPLSREVLMGADRWQRLRVLFDDALERPRGEREAFLDCACADDDALRDEIRVLLASHDRASSFLETPALAEMSAPVVVPPRSVSNLSVGTRLGPYELGEPLGVGGMGEVYRARDTRLNRTVAIKILPAHLRDYPDLRQRFEREAQVISSLNHPHICTLHDVGQQDGLDFLVMEYLEGQTLRQRLASGPVPVAEALRQASDIAQALEVAHDAGVIHRDIKPENIMIRRDGYVKVVDFGLAKLTEQEMQNPEFSLAGESRATRASVLAGTLKYMSPEQKAGERLDARTDLYSLGLVLHEMLTGALPVDGRINTNALTAHPRPMAAGLQKALMRALAVDRDSRYPTASEFRTDLRALEARLESSTRQLWRPAEHAPLAWMVAGLLAAAAVTVTWSVVSNRASLDQIPAPSRADYMQITDRPDEELFPALSPDGTWLAFVAAYAGNWDIYLRRLDEKSDTNLTAPSAADEWAPAFSPEGRRLVFRSQREGGGIFLMDLNTRGVTRLTDFGFNPSWSPDGSTILVNTEDIRDPDGRASISQIWRVNVATGAKQLVSQGDAVQAAWSPNGHRIAFWSSPQGQRDLWTMAADGTDVKPVTQDLPIDWDPVWPADGHHLYFASDRGGSMNLWRVPIEETSGRVSGAPEPVTIPSPYAMHHSFSRDGRKLAYVQVISRKNFLRMAFDSAKGVVTGQQEWVTAGSTRTTNPALSHNGRWLAFDAEGEAQEDLLIIGVDGHGLRRLTNDPYKDRLPVWSPDDSRIAFYSNRSGNLEIWTIRPDGNDLTRVTFTGVPTGVNTPRWSPDGRYLAYHAAGHTFLLDAQKPWQGQTPEPLPAQKLGTSLYMLSWSPDGQKLAGTLQIGKTEVGIVTYDLTTGRYDRLTDHGYAPVWLPDSRRLLFCEADKLYLLDSRTRQAQAIFSAAPRRVDKAAVSPDSRTIYVAVSSEEADIWLRTAQ